MTPIKLSLYMQDTLMNLNNLLHKISPKIKYSADYKNYINQLYFEDNHKKVFFIGGSQISGSVSPFMHTYSSFLNFNPLMYVLFDMTKQNLELKEVYDYILQNPEILGANVTMPYKVDIYKLLQKYGLLDDTAKLVGAVNTLAKVDDKLFGLNTDLYGILKPIKESLGDKKNKVKKGYILGAGGAARAAVGALLMLGVKEITIFNRSIESLKDLQNHFNSDLVKKIIKNDCKINIVKYDQNNPDYNSIVDYIDGKGILINTLPIGFNKKLPSYPIREQDFDKVFPHILLYFEIVYSMEKTQTPISQYLTENYPDIINCNGLDMVVAQAKNGFEMWTNGDRFYEGKISNILKS